MKNYKRREHITTKSLLKLFETIKDNKTALTRNALVQASKLNDDQAKIGLNFFEKLGLVSKSKVNGRTLWKIK